MGLRFEPYPDVEGLNFAVVYQYYIVGPFDKVWPDVCTRDQRWEVGHPMIDIDNVPRFRTQREALDFIETHMEGLLQ